MKKSFSTIECNQHLELKSRDNFAAATEEILCTDAAADELKVGRILRGQNRNEQLLPNLAVRVRDRCHAASRCLG